MNRHLQSFEAVLKSFYATAWRTVAEICVAETGVWTSGWTTGALVVTDSLPHSSGEIRYIR